MAGPLPHKEMVSFWSWFFQKLHFEMQIKIFKKHIYSKVFQYFIGLIDRSSIFISSELRKSLFTTIIKADCLWIV